MLLILIIGLTNLYRSSDNRFINAESGLPSIKVRVLNGCGYDKLASEFSEFLSTKNIEVVEMGDTPRPIYDKSIIVVRRDDEQDLERLKRMTGITRFTYVLSENPKADFDIIVGRDYEDYTK